MDKVEDEGERNWSHLLPVPGPSEEVELCGGAGLGSANGTDGSPEEVKCLWFDEAALLVKRLAIVVLGLEEEVYFSTSLEMVSSS